MNKMLRILLCSAFALTLVTFVSAEDYHNSAGVAGVHVQGTRVILPPAPIFSNCGTGCTSYNTTNGYYLSGSSIATSPNQTLAMGFTTAGRKAFVKALTPNTVYTTNGGATHANDTVYLMTSTSTGPGNAVAKLTHTGSIPDFPKLKTVKYTTTKKVEFKAKTAYFLCESANGGNTQLLWMLSNSDSTSPFFFQITKNSCLHQTWINASGNIGAAFEIN